MRIVKYCAIFFLLSCFVNGNAQLSTNESPIGLRTRLTPIREVVKTVVMPNLDMEKIEAEDIENEAKNMPPRFGYSHKVNYDLNNSGIWYELPNGDKLWQLNIVCPHAFLVSLCFDKFWIPKGGKLFVYSKDKKHSIGAFTSKNNKGDINNPQGLATGFVYGDDVILEYYQPKEVSFDAIVSIEYIVHGYRHVGSGEKIFGDAANCMVNVNCEEGQNWQNEKKAIAFFYLYSFRGVYMCSGALLNTTDLSEKPLFLTANHNIRGIGDAIDNPNISCLFLWNYEAPGCVNVNVMPSSYSTSGATVLANHSWSDFALFRLAEDPKDIVGYTPYYLGWDCTGLSGDPGVCIHHPRGDVKKISTVASQPVPSQFYNYTADTLTHWEVGWQSTLNGHGMTQSGSSGAPLLNSSHKVIGQLTGDNCRDCQRPNGVSKFGRFNYSWTGINNDSIYRRLDYWLDSLNMNYQTMEGLLVIPTEMVMTANEQLYSNVHIKNTGQLTIQGDIELMGNSRVIVEMGGKLIVDGGTMSNVDLVLKAGASLRIINGGILETRNGFYAPVGSSVEIIEGKIL